MTPSFRCVDCLCHDSDLAFALQEQWPEEYVAGLRNTTRWRGGAVTDNSEQGVIAAATACDECRHLHCAALLTPDHELTDARKRAREFFKRAQPAQVAVWDGETGG